MAAPKTATSESVFNRPKSLRIRRTEDGTFEAEYGSTKIEGVVGFQMASSEYGSLATLVFPVGEYEIEEIQTYLKRVFGATMETTEGGVIPGGN